MDCRAGLVWWATRPITNFGKYYGGAVDEVGCETGKNNGWAKKALGEEKGTWGS